MDAVLTASRSLSRKGLIALLSLLAAYNLLVAAFLFAIGAFPVPIFLGLDFLAVLIAFRVSYRRGLTIERVQVTADHIRVLRGSPKGEQTVWTSPTAFTRVAVHRVGEHKTEIQLRLSGRTMKLGAALGPKERSEFGAALERAIRSARSERHAV